MRLQNILTRIPRFLGIEEYIDMLPLISANCTLPCQIWWNVFDGDPIIASFLITAALLLLRSMLFWLNFIQRKNYRLDRVMLEFKKRSFYRLIFSIHRVIVLTAITVPLIGLFFAERYGRGETTKNLGKLWFISLVLYLLLYTLHTIYLAFRRKLRLPHFTIKIIILFLLVTVFESYILFSFVNILPYFILEVLQPLIVLGIFALVYTPNIFLHRYFINRARRKIAAHKNLIVIGITGSYGKTTTKEFLAHILSKKYKVLKTPEHINVDTGVARVILRDLKPEHEVFIVEMGAYKKGEIKKICDLVRPQYGILTGLSDQHLELFGSLQAIVEAKFELVSAVAQSNHVLANEDSAPLVAEFKHRALAPVWYGIHGHGARFRPTNVVFTETGTAFTLHGVSFTAPIFGTAALNNLLGAITTAVELEMHIDAIAPAVQNLPAVQSTMELKRGVQQALLIDDTYNANTLGVITALNDLAYVKRTKKITVFKEVIELGERTNEDHLAIARAMAGTTNYAVLLPSRVRELMRNALMENDYATTHILNSENGDFRKLIDADTVVLCEGRETKKICGSLYVQ